MTYAFGFLALLFVSVLVLGAATGRIQVRSCCAAADPRRDLRMRAAFEDEASE